MSAPLDTVDVINANLVREIVNCTTAQTVHTLLMSIVHSLSETDSL